MAPAHEDPAVHAFLAAGPKEQVAWLRARQWPEAVLLALTNACAQRCFFCAGPGTVSVPPGDVTRAAEITHQLRSRPPGVDRLLVGGNEPTLHPDFEEAMCLAAAAGYTRIDLMTNGQSLAENAGRWAAMGLAEVVVPLYGIEAYTHDPVAGIPCFESVVRGLDAARDAGVRVRVHTLLLRQTLAGLAELSAFVLDRWGNRLWAGLARSKPVYDWNVEAPRLDAIRSALASIPPVSRPGLVEAPLCVHPEGGYPGEVDAPLLCRLYFATQARTWADTCLTCSARAACPGVVRAYAERDAAMLQAIPTRPA